MRVTVSAAALPLLVAVLGVIGCSPANPPAEQRDVVSIVTVDEVEDPATEVGTASTERIPDAGELAGAWLLEDLAGRGVMDMVQTILVFDGEGRVSGSGGCNRFTGSYTFTDGELSLGPLAGTKMMCPEAVMDQEDRFHEALGAIDRVAVDGPFLLIFVAGDDQPMRFTRMDEGQND